MKKRQFEWESATATADAIRRWVNEPSEDEEIVAEVSRIGGEVFSHGDEVLLELTELFDQVQLTPEQLKVDRGDAEAALESLDPSVREAFKLAATNIRAVAEAQTPNEPHAVKLPQGQVVTLRERPVAAAGIYAPGGRASYPSSVLMCAIPAQVAGVERIVLASPPGAGGRPSDSVLAAAAFCGIDEIYAVGGAQAIFALAFGTDTIAQVDVVVGPGNRWVQEAKKRALGFVGIDSYAGPSELMLIVGHDTDPKWAAADLCAQAEHGADSPLLVAAVEQAVLDAIAEQTEAAASEWPSVADAPLALIQVPDLADAVALANAFAPEHLELLEEDAVLMADQMATAGCVFVGRYSATAFGDYVAGSNHVLPTAGSGRFSDPLGPDIFRQKISTVEVPADAAARLAPHVSALARAEGFPVHGESAMIRAKEGS